MLKNILVIWPLFLGILLIGLVAGIQGSLLGIRSTNEGFSEVWLGLVMTTYFAGFLLGSIICPKLIRRVGHVRTFAALTALASMTILLHPLFVDPLLWTFMRLGSGFAISGMIVVIEAWLNRFCSDGNRGQILSIYMVIFSLGLVAGQFLLNLGSPDSYELFTLISVLISFAAVPLLLSNAPVPPIEVYKSISIAQLWRWAPFGVAGIFLINVVFGVIIGMGAVYATKLGLDVFDVSMFMGAFLLGNTLLQWPLGKLSDIFDRRMVICSVALVGCLLSLLAYTMEINTFTGLLVVMLVGGFTLPLYALFIALTNDYMRPEKVLPASGTLILIGGFGTVLGPLLTSFVLEKLGTNSYFLILSVVMAIMVVYGFYRMIVYPYVPIEDRHEFSIYVPSSLGSHPNL